MKNFIIVIHDITPYYECEVRILFNRLGPLVENKLAAAIVPKWHDSNWVNHSFTKMLKQVVGEVLLHGLTHYQTKRMNTISLLTRQANEFTGLNVEEISLRLCRGQQLLQGLFGCKAFGFVPPAWQKGRIQMDILAEQDFRYCMDILSIRWNTGYNIPLATWVWDWGILHWLGYVGEFIGHLLYRLRPSLPCIVFHPEDVNTGYLRFGIHRVCHFLQQGFEPILPKNLIAERTNL